MGPEIDSLECKEMGPEIDSLEYDRQGSSLCKENVVCGGEE